MAKKTEINRETGYSESGSRERKTMSHSVSLLVCFLLLLLWSSLSLGSLTSMAAAQPMPEPELSAARDEVAKNPKKVASQVKLALVALRFHREAEALKAANEALTVAPNDLDARGVLALTRIRSGEFQTGLELFGKLPDPIREKYSLSKTALAAQFAKDAETKLASILKSSDPQDFKAVTILLEDGLRADPENLAIRKMLGWVYLEKANSAPLAFPHLEQVVKFHPEDLNAKKFLALASSNTGRFDSAIALYREVLAKDPSDIWMQINLARTLGWTKQYQQAKQILDDLLRRDPENFHAKKGLVELAEAQDPSIGIQKRFGPLSSEALQLVLEADRETRDGEKTKDRLSFFRAAHALEKAAVLEPANTEIRKTLGYLYLDKVRLPKAALPHLKAAQAINPTDLDTRKLLARAYSQTKHYHKAIVLTREILAEVPDDLSMQINLAKTFSWTQRYPQAVAVYDSILTREPDNFEAELGLAEIMAWRGQTRGAMDASAQLLTRKGDAPQVYSLLGDLYRWSYDLRTAEEHYAAALALDGANREAQMGLHELEKLRSFYVSADYYQFIDSSTFNRSARSGSVRAPVLDGAFVTLRVMDWQFDQGASHVARLDESVDFEFHCGRNWESHLKFLNYDYDGFRAEQSLGVSTKWSPRTDRAFFLSLAWKEPAVLDSINIVLNNIRQDVIGTGFDVNLWGKLSAQGAYTFARYSDDNERRFASTQISYKIFRVPEVYFRCQYDALSYTEASPLYFSPGNFQIVRPMADASYSVNDRLAIRATYSFPYVLEQKRWGHGIMAGATLKLVDRVEVNASYFNHRVPAVAPFSGEGFQVVGTLRF